MKLDIADKWIAALRSGEYKQAVGALYDGEGYCCLGVLCKVLGEEFTKDNEYWEVDGEYSVLPGNLVERAGMYSPAGCFWEGDDETERSLTEENDNGQTFEEIADIIERHKHKL